MDIMIALALAAMAATVVALVAGISSMAINGEIAHHTSGEWMIARVTAQGAALLFVALAQLA